MTRDINIVKLCDELYKGLKEKGCGMAPIEARGLKEFNGTFVNIVIDALKKARE